MQKITILYKEHYKIVSCIFVDKHKTTFNINIILVYVPSLRGQDNLHPSNGGLI